MTDQLCLADFKTHITLYKGKDQITLNQDEIVQLYNFISTRRRDWMLIGALSA